MKYTYKVGDKVFITNPTVLKLHGIENPFGTVVGNKYNNSFFLIQFQLPSAVISSYNLHVRYDLIISVYV